MNLSFTLTPTRITRTLLMIIGCLLVPNLVSNYIKWVLGYNTAFGFVPMFNFDQEYNIPSLYSSLAILFSAALLWWIAKDEKVKGNQQARYWKALSFIFIFLSLDEMISLHNQLGRLTPILFGNIYQLSGSRYWILPYVPLLVLFFIFFLKFYIKLPKPTKILFAAAGVTFIGGAIGVEILGDQYMFFHDYPDFNYGLISTLEELFEMIGIVLFIHGLVSYITSYSKTSQIKIQMNLSPKVENSSIDELKNSSVALSRGPEELSTMK